MMTLDIKTSVLIILLMALTTFATRVIPFLVFPKGRQIPKVVEYLGKVLTPAIIGMLVVYCLKATVVLKPPHALPEVLAIALVVVLHRWKRNNLLSIGVGTLFYMVMIQMVF